ncbi:MAG TPA: alpha/beta hydrolase [Gammaproteobacteria bacterium]|nr:alpha/beta hydrolase [Gammaproteobacteria bacterium]
MFFKFISGFLLILICIALQSCASGLKHTHRVLADAHHKGFKQEILSTSKFKLTTLHRITEKNAPLVVYLEGDGHSQSKKYRLSKDPTPHQPLALELALLDPRPNVIYIARPCQYSIAEDAECNAMYWSTHKFAPEVINSTQEVINHFRSLHENKKIELVGFSGGGGLAVMIAAQDPRIINVTTIAGDLDIELMQKHHNTTPLTGSKNPKRVATSINKIPQRHFIGKKDVVVPLAVAESFVHQVGACAKIIALPKFEHHKGWKEAWPFLLTEPFPCG